MSENKSFWVKLKGWVDGDEVIFDADEYIAGREKTDKVLGEEFLGEKKNQMERIRSNSTLYHVLSVLITACFIIVM
ncbi:MAG: hypothetical protein Q4C06_03640, partial [Bacillota bacterium]|nr:hypothetical protein [Bacillota bacterium]